MSLPRALRQTLTIARRDFVATVFTPVFLLFLFAPVIMGSFGAIGGLGAASMSARPERVRVVAIVPDALARPYADNDARLRAAFRNEAEAPPPLSTVRPAADFVAQATALIASDNRSMDVAAVSFGPPDRLHILYRERGSRAADYLQLLAETGAAGTLPRIDVVKQQVASERRTARDDNQAGFLAVFGIFFLTLFLAGQVVGTMAEERNSKVIEVLAAAVPLESVFLGKLLGMFGVALLFVGFWAAVIGQIGALLPPSAAAAFGGFAPAIGGPIFALLFAGYFTMAYLLLGSVFLSVGAQASSMREIQMLSLPITILQVAMFALASAAASHPGGWVATAAQVFPLSSPFAMAGLAATSRELFPHAAALVWQALWVALFITVGARLFRRGVLQSGSARPRRRKLNSA